MATSAGSFAQGLVTGYAQGRQMKERRELHELKTAQLQEERDMREAFKQIEKDHSVDEQWAVSLDGENEVVYGNRDEALKAAGDKGHMRSVYSVAGQQYNSMHEATQAQDILNSPAQRMGMMAQIAAEYGRPELATQFYGAQQTMLDAQRRNLQDVFLRAQQTGNLQGVLNYMNHVAGPHNAQTRIVPGEGDQVFMQQVNANGEVLSQQAFQNLDQVWQNLYQGMMTTPDNMLAVFTAERNFNFAQEQFAHQQNVDAQRIGLQAGQLGLANRRFEWEQSQPFGLNTITGVNPANPNETMVGGSYYTRDSDGLQHHTTTPVATGINRPPPSGLGMFGPNFGQPEPFAKPDADVISGNLQDVPSAPQGPAANAPEGGERKPGLFMRALTGDHPFSARSYFKHWKDQQ